MPLNYFNEETIPAPGWYFWYPTLRGRGYNPMFMFINEVTIADKNLHCKGYAGTYIGPYEQPPEKAPEKAKWCLSEQEPHLPIKLPLGDAYSDYIYNKADQRRQDGLKGN